MVCVIGIHGFHRFRCPAGERVLTIGYGAPFVGEAASLRGLFPVVTSVGHVEISAFPPVGVNNQLVGGQVAFARRHHIGAGIFEHRNEIGEHESLGKQVLNGAEQPGALPPPLGLPLVIIFSVALPYGDNAVVQTFL